MVSADWLRKPQCPSERHVLAMASLSTIHPKALILWTVSEPMRTLAANWESERPKNVRLAHG